MLISVHSEILKLTNITLVNLIFSDVRNMQKMSYIITHLNEKFFIFKIKNEKKNESMEIKKNKFIEIKK